MWSRHFSVAREWVISHNKNHRGVLTIFLLIILIVFYCKNNLLFKIWIMFWCISRIYFSFLAYKRLRAIVELFSSIFFELSFSIGKSISCELLTVNSVIFVIFCGSFLTSTWFNVTATTYWKHLLYFLLIGFIVAFCFLSSQKNLYMIHQGH